MGLCMLKGGVPISGAVAGRPFVSNGGWTLSDVMHPGYLH